ncbi:type I methionyl aminopeptidase [Candidatus Parcubacteria bacterium]|nr:type I methionyl aminopeptidase [Candidatus Parcubacteria bacterium]MBI4098962.1 type I methionyl aminopeptidase [Candidatus Parcubacteria bacterium]
MLQVKTNEEIAIMREGGRILARMLRAVAREVRAGVSTAALNEFAERLISDVAVTPAFKGYRNFPTALCVSVNDEVVHGVPSERVIKAGDVVGLDLGIRHRGFYTDTSVTVGVEPLSAETRRLIEVTRKALEVGIHAAEVGATTGDVGWAIEQFVGQHGFSVVRELVGHGVGRKPHEEPMVPNTGKPGGGVQLTVGMTLAIEPMVVTGGARVVEGARGVWKTKDGGCAAHFEHTVAITASGPEVLTMA